MRLVVIDTETTGLSPKNGDKMVEIGAIAIEHGQVQMEQVFHRFIDPQCEIPHQVVEIHGIDAAKLAAEEAKPFAEIGAEFLEFIAGATLVFHNASFDLGFIKNELANAGLPGIDAMPVIDTLSMARQRFPKQPNNLDALCDRFAIDHSHRASHGALIDATLTAHCFLAMSDEDSVPASEDEPSALPTQSIIDLVRDVYFELEQRHKKALGAPLPTGIEALDEKHGGIQSGDLILIAGEADSGKTALASGIVHQLAFREFDPCSVLIFSLRQSALQWIEHALGSEAKVDDSVMQSGRIHAKHWRAFAAVSGKMAESDMHICDASPVSIQEMANTCRQHNHQTSRLVILIDDLHRITVPETASTNAPDYSAISRSLKSLATELKAAIILLAELPASSEHDANREPELSDLHCLGTIDQGADIILLTHRSLRNKLEISIAQ